MNRMSRTDVLIMKNTQRIRYKELKSYHIPEIRSLTQDAGESPAGRTKEFLI